MKAKQGKDGNKAMPAALELYVHEPMCGSTISKTAVDMVTAVTLNGYARAEATFNDIKLSVDRPSGGMSSIAEMERTIVDYYYAESARRRDEYLASDEYKEQQRAYEEKVARERIEYEDAISQAPTSMSYIEGYGEAKWKAFVDANQDGYGGAVVQFAETWARLVEGAMEAGGKFEEVVDSCSRIADSHFGITGFMYGCAISTLADTWKHGEQLRRWHNSKTQINGEGDKANANGGVLNPALLCIGGGGGDE